MDMGLGGGAGYSGPTYSAAATQVPASGGYPDAGYGQMAFGSTGIERGADRSSRHALRFGAVCFVLLVVYWWTLPK